jgi:hypothetical protein
MHQLAIVFDIIMNLLTRSRMVPLPNKAADVWIAAFRFVIRAAR